MKGYTAAYGRIVVPEGNAIDDAVVFVFRTPQSYTGEDTAEICCHGGPFILQTVLRTVLAAGAVAAQPGEFSKLAFTNGKLRLNEAEAVLSLIGAQGEAARRLALAAKDGAATRRIEKLKQLLLATSARLSFWSDFPNEGETGALTQEELTSLETELSSVKAALETLLRSYDQCKSVFAGIEVAIVGKPNVGKSSILNRLLGSDRAIVTSVPGTTRDIVSETVCIGEAVVKLSDTAGIRVEHSGEAEEAGIERSMKRIACAAIVIAVFDGSRCLDQDDLRIIEKVTDKVASEDKRILAIINKADLNRKLNIEDISNRFTEILEVSAKTGVNFDTLDKWIEKTALTDSYSEGEGVLTTERQRECVAESLSGTNDALKALQGKYSLDAVSVCVEEALSALLALTGERVSGLVVDEVFSRFCVGK
jgi:tRNA modification GTPase